MGPDSDSSALCSGFCISLLLCSLVSVFLVLHCSLVPVFLVLHCSLVPVFLVLHCSLVPVFLGIPLLTGACIPGITLLTGACIPGIPLLSDLLLLPPPTHPGELPKNHAILREISSLCHQLPILTSSDFNPEHQKVSPGHFSRTAGYAWWVERGV